MAPLHCFNHDVFKSNALENPGCPFAEDDDDSWIFEPSVKKCVYLIRRRSNSSAGAPDTSYIQSDKTLFFWKLDF